MDSPYPSPAEFFQRLSTAPDSSVESLVDFFLFEGVPFALKDWEEYSRFRRELSDRLGINAKSIVRVEVGEWATAFHRT